mgnify:CR=1 FL=1
MYNNNQTLLDVYDIRVVEDRNGRMSLSEYDKIAVIEELRHKYKLTALLEIANIDYYNKRIKSKLKGLSPFQYRIQSSLVA